MDEDGLLPDGVALPEASAEPFWLEGAFPILSSSEMSGRCRVRVRVIRRYGIVALVRDPCDWNINLSSIASSPGVAEPELT